MDLLNAAFGPSPGPSPFGPAGGGGSPIKFVAIPLSRFAQCGISVNNAESQPQIAGYLTINMPGGESLVIRQDQQGMIDCTSIKILQDKDADSFEDSLFKYICRHCVMGSIPRIVKFSRVLVESSLAYQISDEVDEPKFRKLLQQSRHTASSPNRDVFLPSECIREILKSLYDDDLESEEWTECDSNLPANRNRFVFFEKDTGGFWEYLVMEIEDQPKE